MIDRAISKGLTQNKIFLFPNWADFQSDFKPANQQGVTISNTNSSYRKQLKLSPKFVIALYSVNMGAKQGLEILGQLARQFNDVHGSASPVHFIFCGDGVGRTSLIEQCKGLNFVHFLDLQPKENLASFLSTADVHLLSQRADAADLVMPSKLAGMLASGRPILACAHVGTELEKVVRGCGLIVPPEDPQSLYDGLVTLIGDSNLREKLGRAGLQYANNNLRQDNIMSDFEFKLKNIIQ